MPTTKSLKNDVTNLQLRRAGDGSIQVGGTFTAELVYDISDIGEQVRRPVALDLGLLYSRLSTAERNAIEQTLGTLIGRLGEVARNGTG